MNSRFEKKTALRHLRIRCFYNYCILSGAFYNGFEDGKNGLFRYYVNLFKATPSIIFHFYLNNTAFRAIFCVILGAFILQILIYPLRFQLEISVKPC